MPQGEAAMTCETIPKVVEFLGGNNLEPEPPDLARLGAALISMRRQLVPPGGHHSRK